MILLKEFRGELLIFINDTIARYNLDSKVYKEHHIPKLQPNEEQPCVSSVCVSKNHDYLAVALDNKQLITFDNAFNVLTNTLCKRSVSRIKFSLNNDLLIADKTGDVFLYKRDSGDKPQLVLGHLSMLLDIEVSECGKYIITSDRDEKIRVSCYPNAYNIVSFCLGHREFVTNVAAHGDVLISASGDGTIRLWNYLNGNELALANSNDHISDKTVISDFCKGMSAESVDVETVPIKDMQVFVKDNLIYASSPLLAFYLNEQLVLLTSNDLTIYDWCGQEQKESSLKQVYGHCKHLFSNYIDLSSSMVSTLYKRKYDNVQDYLDKKKMRLENKS
ncbi:hypothetical protein FQR65_LT10373 [Abscondita terminalis]|nr:hypothetical protein FQR65_LT10373 [Abscondita terminalis]